jgi:alpha-1,2-mannosyltransferase
MRADAGLTVRATPSGRQHRGGAARGRVLLAAGTAVAGAAAVAYLVAIAAHPMTAMLKGFDLRVYLGGARQALSRPGQLYAWTYDDHPGIQFTYTPFAALLFAAGLGLRFTALMSLVTVTSVLALGVTVAIAFRELGWRGTPRLGATLLVAGLALWTEPVQRALFLGQVEIMLMALVTWDLCQPDGRRLKGAATGLAAGVKLVPLLFIAYLLLAGRFRQAAVAAGAFAVTVVIGWAAFPSASVAWWLGGDFLQAGRTGFVGGQPNQSLRGALTRLAGSVNGAQPAWLAVAVAVALAGLAAAVLLRRRGRSFAGLIACALTALLVSPISWDHHWVWLAPGLALLIDAGRRAPGHQPRHAGSSPPSTASPAAYPPTPPPPARPPAPSCPPPARLTATGAAWYALAAATWALFASWPDFWSAKAGLLQGGLIGYAPASAWAHGDNPAYAEYHWHGLQLLAGNLELLAGLILFTVLLTAAVRPRRPPPGDPTRRLSPRRPTGRPSPARLPPASSRPPARPTDRRPSPARLPPASARVRPQTPPASWAPTRRRAPADRLTPPATPGDPARLPPASRRANHPLLAGARHRA